MLPLHVASSQVVQLRLVEWGLISMVGLQCSFEGDVVDSESSGLAALGNEALKCKTLGAFDGTCIMSSHCYQH